jgi:hypothetical protein
MTKLKCKKCKISKTNVQVREGGDKLCNECFYDEAEEDGEEEQANEVGDNRRRRSNTMSMQPGQFEIVLNKMTELCEKIGQMLFVKDRVLEITKSQDFLSSKFDKQTEELESLRAENKVMNDEMAVLMNDVFDLKKTNEELRLRVDDLEQYSRNNNVEITGIPETPQEDVMAVVRAVGEKLKMEVVPDDFEAVHRVPTQSQTMPKPILVRFLRRRRKEEMIAKGKKIHLKGTDIHETFGEKPVFINEHLIPERKKLLSVCREKKNELDIKYLWTKAGTILMKKADSSKTVKILRVQDILKVT